MATEQDPILQRIQSLVHRRTETDRRMGYAWMIVPLLPLAVAIAVGATFVGILIAALPKIANLSQPQTAQNAIEPIAGGLSALFGFGIIATFVVFFVGALSFYYLLDRRNRHFGRQQLLFAAIHRYLTFKRSTSENIAQLGYLSDDSTYTEGPRPAGLWALLALFATPIVCLIASYNLTQDMRRHDELQSKYQASLASALTEAGFQESNLPGYKSHSRDPVLFLILTAITGGLFWIYWYYTLLKDYNDHFTDQAQFEEQVLKILIPPPAERICGTCGGSVPAVAKFCPNCGRQQTG